MKLERLNYELRKSLEKTRAHEEQLLKEKSRARETITDLMNIQAQNIDGAYMAGMYNAFVTVFNSLYGNDEGNRPLCSHNETTDKWEIDKE